jgi:hypothetical protein
MPAMGRVRVSIPFQFTDAPGDQPASKLDSDFEAVNDNGILTIRAQELSTGADYNVLEDDEYSFFVCKGVTDFQVIPPTLPNHGFGFFLANETTQEPVQIGVTICCTIFVGETSYLNPVLIRDFAPNFFNVKGGLVQWDGSRWNFYPLYFATIPGAAFKKGTATVNSGDSSVTITHGLNQADLPVLLLPQWNTQIYQTAQNNTTVTFEFSNPVPSLSPPVLDLTYIVFLQ